VERWSSVGSGQVDPVLVKGVISSTLGLLTTHVVTRQPEPMIALLAPLVSLVASPFLGPEAVREDVASAARLTQEIREGRSPRPQHPAVASAGIPEALLRPGARRSRECLSFLARNPGASNHEVGKGLAITHPSQTSTLLARLERMGLLAKRSGAPGHANAWTLTPEGERIAEALEEYK
jgi:hypothetical protein